MNKTSSLQITPHWVGGQRDVRTTGNIPVMNPATGFELRAVANAAPDVIEDAVASCLDAFQSWSNLPASRRSQVLYEFRNLLREHADEIAANITQENGKTLDDALGEVHRGIDAVELAAAAPFVLKGEISEQTGRNIDTFATLHPLGVFVGITPFNFPVMIPLMMFAVAIACGNAFILKPSEQAPTSSFKLAELAKQAGLPDGVLNVVHGGANVVEALIDHPEIAGVSFVGSTPIARMIYERAAARGKRVQAMGGAKNHLVVAPDADFAAAADALSSAAYGSAGQRCMAVTTAVAIGSGADELVALLKDRAAAIVMGNGSSGGSEMGPVISAAAQERVRGFVNRAIHEGADSVVNRSTEPVHGNEGGYFVGPVLLDAVQRESEIYRNEVFGPVLIVVRVETFAEALELIRTNPYGNGASLFTRSGALARRFQREATAGMVGINVPIPVPVAQYAVAGWKDSVFGDTGLNNGSWRFYTQPKYVTTRWDESAQGVDLGFRPN